MKNLFRLLLAVSIWAVVSCANEETITPEVDLNETVTALAGADKADVQVADMEAKEWKFTNWNLDFYSNSNKVGAWDGYSKTINEVEKNQTYRLQNGVFQVVSVDQGKKGVAMKSFNYSQPKPGVLLIDGVEFIIKQDGGLIYVYYNVKDNVKVGAIFNVTIDNTFGDSLGDADLVGLGVIELRNTGSVVVNNQISTHDLTVAFVARSPIFGGLYYTISNDSTDLFMLEQGDTLDMSVVFDELVEVQVDNARVDSLFNAFLLNRPFKVLGDSLDLYAISVDSVDMNLLHVGAYTKQKENVRFAYFLDRQEANWEIAPVFSDFAGVVISGSDLVSKFTARAPIDGTVYDQMSAAAYGVICQLWNNNELRHANVMLSTEVLELDGVTSVRARNLFYALFTFENFDFDGVELRINEIICKDNTPGSFIVHGNIASTWERVSFYYNTATAEEYWIKRKRQVVMQAYDLVDDFLNKRTILDSLYTKMEILAVDSSVVLTNAHNMDSLFVTWAGDYVDVSNIEHQLAKPVFQAFFSKTNYEVDDRAFEIATIELSQNMDHFIQLNSRAVGEGFPEFMLLFGFVTGEASWIW